MLEFLLSLAGAIAGGVICHYLIKWLDSPKDDN